MSRVEKFLISSDLPVSGEEPYKRMVASLARRTRRSRMVENEIENLMEDIVVIPEEGTTGEKERSLSSKETRIVSSYPLGWTKIRRY